MRLILRYRLVVVALMLWTLTDAAPAAPANASRPPNIVVILADDLGYTDLGVYGSSFYETPNLDRLAAQGMRFTQAYASCPVCSPSRASLNTGRYPARVGLTNYLSGTTYGRVFPADFLRALPQEELTLAEGLKSAGYATWHVGKWHLGPDDTSSPLHHGFEAYATGVRKGSEEKKSGDFLTDEAIRLIRENGKDRPFYLNYCAYAPHIPIRSPEALVEKYEEKARRLKLDTVKAVEEGEFFPTENKKTKRVVRRSIHSHPAYAGMVENLDTDLGRLLDFLDESGHADNTLVIFTSDNGGVSTSEGSPTSNAPLRNGKGWMYEGGIRVPLIVRWPGVVKEGSVSSAVVTTPDHLPTCFAAAGTGVPEDTKLDGLSLMPVLRGSEESLAREALYWHYPHYGNQGGSPAAAVRAGEWKLIQFFEGDRFELYNLKDDLSETNDLLAEHPEIAGKLKAMLQNWQKDVGAKLPTPNPEYQPHTAGALP